MRWYFLLLAAGSIFAQQFPALSGRLQDLDFAANQIPSRHPNFFFKLDRLKFQQAASELQSRAATLTDAQFYVGIAQLIAMAGDAHTFISFAGGPVRLFPLRFRWLDDGIFVVRASAPFSRALGTQLVQVDGVAIDEVVQRVGTVFPHENDQWLHAAVLGYLAGQTVLQGLGILPETPTSKLTFRALDGTLFTLDVDTDQAQLISAVSPDQGPVPYYQQHSGTNYWYAYLANGRLLYFKYNACSEIPGEPFAAFAANLLETMDKNPVDTLVIDYRGNGGGNSSIIAPLFNGLAQRYPALSANPSFRIYNVFDKGTFSSALRNAADLKIPVPSSIPTSNWKVNLSTLVTSIGEPTGGKPSGYGNVNGFTLPASGFAGQVSTRYFNAPPGIPDGLWLAPDVAISIRSTDYFARFDPVMAAIMARSKGAPAMPSGDVIVVNGATFRTDHGIASGSFASAFGAFSATPDSVLVGGIVAQGLSADKSQVNFVVPSSLPAGPITVSVWAAGRKLAEGAATISATGPGIFVLGPGNPTQPGAVLNQDGAVNSAASPAQAGSIVQIFATGYSPEATQVLFADIPGDILYSGPIAVFPGLWQINVRLPADVSGLVPFYLISGSLASNGSTISVR